jgi:hypothetical protein
MREDGGPLSAFDLRLPVKSISAIAHGPSIAPVNGRARVTDDALSDRPHQLAAARPQVSPFHDSHSRKALCLG